MSTNEINGEQNVVEEHILEASHHEEHHDHHEHHHRHHRRHRSKKRSSKKSARQSLLKNKKFWINSIIILAALVFLVSMSMIGIRHQKGTAKPEEIRTEAPAENQAYNGAVSVTLPFFNDEVYLVDEAVLALMRADVTRPTLDILDSYRKEQETVHLDKGLPVDLFYDVSGLPADSAVTGAKVKVTETETGFTRVFRLEKNQQGVSVRHLKTGTHYDYRVEVELSNGTVSTVGGSFQTAKTPRILSIDNIVNVRDIGGWDTVDGKTVKQGLLYRGSEMDGAVEPEYSLSAAGLEDMMTALSVNTDIDLRPADDNKYGVDPLGAGVEHIYIGGPDYENVFSDWGKACVREVFSLLAQEERYPIYLHCTYGMDRTGSMCCLLGAMLGMEEDDLLRDYRLSALHFGSVSQDKLEAMIAELKTYPGSTMQEKTENYLLSVDVTGAEIETIKQILLEQ